MSQQNLSLRSLSLDARSHEIRSNTHPLQCPLSNRTFQKLRYLKINARENIFYGKTRRDRVYAMTY